MAHLSSFIAAGLASVLAWDMLGAPRPLEGASADTAVSRTAQSQVTPVDRSRKGDRLSAPSASVTHPAIAKVEFGPGDTVLLRDRSGGTLFSADPAAQRTIIAKDVALPQFTVQTSVPASPEVSAPLPVAAPEVPRGTIVSAPRKPEGKRPAGCDPAFSPIAAPQLGHIFGRCITSIESPTRFAQALDNSQLPSVQ